MQNDKLSLLQENLRYLGFGESESLNKDLVLAVRKRPKKFQLITEAFFDEWSEMTAVLYFQWFDEAETYLLIGYTALLHYTDDPGNDKEHTFSIAQRLVVTFKEAFNLLQGRAVNKDLIDDEGKKYNAWIQLDFRELTPTGEYKVRKYRIEYGYDLEKILYMYPIRELEIEELKENLIRSLKKGNLHPVTFIKGNKVEKMYIEACPQFKIIGICSEAVRSVHHSTSKRPDYEKEGISGNT